MKKALIIFVRHPELGNVKTRLAAQIGDAGALYVYQELLQHTLQITRLVHANKAVFYAATIVPDDLWNEKNYYKFLQTGDDLGSRMQAAFQAVFGDGYEQAVIVGSDCFELDSLIIESAFNQLENHDVVIGPAKDGGYYLLGLKKLRVELFQNKHWSTPSVFEETMTTIRQLQKSVYTLPLLSDVDEEKDLPADLREKVSYFTSL